MKIVSLNVWHGKCVAALRAFLSLQHESADIFCFQEANGSEIEDIVSTLFHEPEFHVLSAVKGQYCVCTIVRNTVNILGSTPLLVDNPNTGLALVVELQQEAKRFVSVNVHGVPYPGSKLDSDSRLRQSSQIIKWLVKNESPAVVCGDFNLEPSTESVQLFSLAGYHNLIQDYNITTTRNRLTWEKWPDNKQYYADYTFVSPGAAVASFTVPDGEMSDHLPMITDFDILSQNESINGRQVYDDSTFCRQEELVLLAGEENVV